MTKIMNFNKKISLIILSIIAISLGSYVGVQGAGYEGTILGLKSWQGYFHGIINGDPDNAGPVLPTSSDGNSIPTSINNANDFIYYIKTASYENGGVQAKVGAAFIVNTMLGHMAPGSGTNVPEKDWTDFINRINERDKAGKIEWNTTITNAGAGINSYYQIAQQDDAFYSAARVGSGIRITNDDGSTYLLLHRCANPIGKINEILPVNWTTEVSATVKATAIPGEKVTWQHNAWITNGGPSTELVEYGWMNSSGFDADEAKLGELQIGTQAGTGDKKNSPEYIVQPDDVGKKFCRKTYATPRAKGDKERVISEEACVTITSTIANGSCRPMIVSVPSHTQPGHGSGGSEGDSAVASELVSVSLKMINQATGATVNYGSYTGGADVDVTVKCTTGDKWTIHIDIAGHIESWKSYRCGYRNRYTCYTAIPAVEATLHKDIGTAGPCYDYLLKTATSALSYQTVEVNSNVTFAPSLSLGSWTQTNLPEFYNTYRTKTKSKVTQWQVSKLIVVPNSNVQNIAAATSKIEPCTYYKSVGFNRCEPLNVGSGNIFSPGGSLVTGPAIPTSITNNISDEPAGSKICYAFSAMAADSEDSNESATPSNLWGHSAVSTNFCVIVVKKPKVQVWGGDLSVGKAVPTLNKNIATTTSVKSFGGDNILYGSWAEYGVLASGSVSGLASASAFSGGLGGVTVSQNCQYSRLTFNNNCSNTASSSSLGGYKFTGQKVPDISKSFPVNSSTPTLPSSVSVDYFNAASANVFTSNGSIDISGGTLSKGRWAVINAPNSTVTISGSIQYTSASLNGINDIPQLVIIAKNINIKNSAAQVDAWLIANSGYINTCSDVSTTTNLTTNICNNPLTINGPVSAQSLYLRRTAGSNPGEYASGDPAEVINLRADSYLWSYARSTGSGRVWTVYTTNVPPRL